MQFLQQLKTVPSFVEYFLKVVDQHSLQAPFAYKFYTQLIRAIKHSAGIGKIEEIRESMLKDQTVISGHDYGAGSRIICKNKVKTVSSIAQTGISSKKDCIFLSEVANIIRPGTCIELGSSLGIATAYLSKVDSVQAIYSFEGNKMLATMTRDMLKQLNVGNTKIIHGNIDVELPRILDHIDHLDFALIDANHTEKALLSYYNMLCQKMSDDGIIIVDDIRWSIEMYFAWKKLVNMKEVMLSMEFLNKGLLFFKKGVCKQHYILSI